VARRRRQALPLLVGADRELGVTAAG